MNRSTCKQRVLAILGAALFSIFIVTPANASTLTVSWANPTLNTNGTTIPATGTGSLTQTRVEWGSCSAPGVFGVKASEVIVLAPATSVSITSIPDGTTACFRAYASNTYGVESAASVVVSKTLSAPTPNAPVLSSTVTVN